MSSALVLPVPPPADVSRAALIRAGYVVETTEIAPGRVYAAAGRPGVRYFEAEATASEAEALDLLCWTLGVQATEAPEVIDRDEIDARIDADRDAVVEAIDREIVEPADLGVVLHLALRFVPLHVEAQDHRTACRCVACVHRAATLGGR